MKIGDRIQVKPEHDIPEMFRQGPTEGVITDIYDDVFMVSVPIGDDDPDEHSQCVPYRADQVVAVGRKQPS